MEFRKQAHAVYHCQYHLILATKYRRKIFNAGMFAYFKIKLLEIRKYYPAVEIIEANHDRDHVHLLAIIPPKMSVGSVVRIIKSNTSRSMKQKFPILKKVYYGSDGIWSQGYFVSTVGINEKAIKMYIAKQGKEDSGQAKLELG